MITWKKNLNSYTLFENNRSAILHKQGSKWVLNFEGKRVPIKNASKAEVEEVFSSLRGKSLSSSVTSRYIQKNLGRYKTAGEVIFKKDNSNDSNAWGYANNSGSDKRNTLLIRDFNYSPKNAKPLSQVLRSVAGSLGHCISAYNRFTRIKSSTISPDGSLGGRGVVMKVSDIRKQLSNSMEALSAISDTLYDEITAPHWSVMSRQEGDEDKAQTQELIEDTEKIREDPEQWAEEEMKEEFGE